MDHNRPVRLMYNRIERPFKGGLLLDILQNKTPPQDAYEAESWIGSTTQVAGNKKLDTYGLSKAIIEDQEYLLKDLINHNPEGYLGKAHVKKFGTSTAVLIKLIDSYSRLLIQVHPTKAYAKQFLNSDYGKTEAWHILETRVIDGIEPHVYIGFKQGITREIWQDLFEKQDIAEMLNWMHKVPVKIGDTVWIPSGVPHAIGSGCLLVEIQEPTDFTMRVERHRLDDKKLGESMLHNGLGIEKMLDCFHYNGYLEEQILTKHFLATELNVIATGIERFTLIDKAYTNLFSMYKYHIEGSVSLQKENAFCIAIVTEGAGEIQYKGYTIPLVQGDEIFIPASGGDYQYRASNMKIIECYAPQI